MEEYASSGSGTNAEPYIIENRVFTSDFRIDLFYNPIPFAFVIQNCKFTSSLGLTGINKDFEGFSPNSKDVIIRDNEFLGGNLGIVLSLIHTIKNNTFSSSTRGLKITMSVVENIFNNSLVDSTFDVKIASNYESYPTLFSVFENNTINGIEIGFFENEANISIVKNYSQLFIFNSSSVSIVNQTIFDTYVGIKIGFCFNITITNSSVSNSETGVYIRNSNQVIIMNNTLSDNSVGIEHEYISSHISIQFNEILNSTSFAIISEQSSFCLVTLNNFIDNALEESSQSYDSGMNNDWEYNYWSDWISGDYRIAGIGPHYEYDKHPLSSPVIFS
jgi:parallel beta-helix repeat protein